MRRLRDTGDTIIEVLIALTVVASMLGGAYVTTNRSLGNNRQAQERGEALKLAEAQLERLKGIVSTGSTQPYTITGDFCIDTNNTIQPITPQACTVSAGGPQYTMAISRQANDHFSVSVSWERFGGNGTDSIGMDYRLHPVSTTFAVAEPVPQPDLCPNIAGLQVTVPVGMIVDGSGNCVSPDVCPNIAGVQTSVPAGMFRDASGNCVSANIAQGKSATDDSGCTYPYYAQGTPNTTIDGNRNSLWYTGAYCFRVRVDLGQAYNLRTINAFWGYFGHNYGWGYYINQYRIEVSSNGSSWTTVGSGSSWPNTDMTTVNGNYNNVRYIRVEGRSSQNWIGIYEIEAFQ